MASAKTTTTTSANGLRSVEGSKPGNSRKRQLANRDAELTASPPLKGSTTEVDLTGDSPSTSTSTTTTKQVKKKLFQNGEEEESSDGESLDDWSGDEELEEGEEPAAKKVKTEPTETITPPSIPLPPIPAVKKDKTKKASSKQSARCVK